jgi:hypothetical protein
MHMGFSVFDDLFPSRTVETIKTWTGRLFNKIRSTISNGIVNEKAALAQISAFQELAKSFLFVTPKLEIRPAIVIELSTIHATSYINLIRINFI